MWAVVVGGGQGRRFGGAKQFESLGGRLVMDWAIDAARSVAAGVVAVLPAGAGATCLTTADVAVSGGATRSESVRAGLAVLPEDVEVVVVHDAARPLAAPSLFEAVVDALARSTAAGVIPVLPVTETIKRVVDGRVVATLARHELGAVQTPQAFRAGPLRAAHARGGDATDDAALVEALGQVVLTVPGDARNLKLTTPEDMALAEILLLRA